MGTPGKRRLQARPHRRQSRRIRPPPPSRHHLVVAGRSGDPAKSSRVTFEIEPPSPDTTHPLVGGSKTKLTVTHDELDPSSEMRTNIAKGWPIVFSGLKTFLETGKTLSAKK